MYFNDNSTKFMFNIDFPIPLELRFIKSQQCAVI